MVIFQNIDVFNVVLNVTLVCRKYLQSIKKILLKNKPIYNKCHCLMIFGQWYNVLILIKNTYGLRT